MEDVLALDQALYDARYPTVCLDEKSVVLHAESRAAGSPATRHAERQVDEYEWHGAANLFVMVEPLAGWRRVAVTARRPSSWRWTPRPCMRPVMLSIRPPAAPG